MAPSCGAGLVKKSYWNNYVAEINRRLKNRYNTLNKMPDGTQRVPRGSFYDISGLEDSFRPIFEDLPFTFNDYF